MTSETSKRIGLIAAETPATPERYTANTGVAFRWEIGADGIARQYISDRPFGRAVKPGKDPECFHISAKPIKPVNQADATFTDQCCDCGALIGAWKQRQADAEAPAQPERKRYTREDIANLKWGTECNPQNMFGDHAKAWATMKDGQEFMASFRLGTWSTQQPRPPHELAAEAILAAANGGAE